MTLAPHGMLVQSGIGHAAQAPAALHALPVAQAPPQLTFPPQPSGAVPHVLLPQACAAAVGAQQALA